MSANREWDREWYAKRRQRAEGFLGGKCNNCGVTEYLQFDHVVGKAKAFEISGNLNRRWEALLPELSKCQLLCKPCHIDKTRRNAEHAGGHNKWAEIQHGKAHAYSHYGCRCPECRAAAGRPRPRHVADHGSKSMYSYHKCRCDICREGNRQRQQQWRMRS